MVDYGRIWRVCIYDANDCGTHTEGVYDRDKMAQLLQEYDGRGYFIDKWSLQCLHGSDFLVNCEVSLRFGNFCICNIPEMLDEILGTYQEEQK